MPTVTARSRSPRRRRREGVAQLGVATLHEGIQLRQAGCRLPIVVLSPLLPSEIDEAVAHELDPTVSRPRVRARAVRRRRRAPGARCAATSRSTPAWAAPACAKRRRRSSSRALVRAAGAPAGERLHALPATPTREDLDVLRASRCAASARCSTGSRRAGIRPPRVHAANSAGTLNLPDARFDWLRVGLLAYGHLPPHARARSPVAAGDVVQEPAGAGARPAARARRSATRAPSSPARPIAHRRRAGRLRPRLLVAALQPRRDAGRAGAACRSSAASPWTSPWSTSPTVPDAGVGDEVVLFGEQGDASLSLEEVARVERDAALRDHVHDRQARHAHLRARRPAGQAHDAGRRERGVGRIAAGRPLPACAREAAGRGAARAERMRVFLIVLDGVGIGALPDAADYGDAGSHTLRHVAEAVGGLRLPTLERLGLGRHRCRCPACARVAAPRGARGRLAERSPGKDSTTGHWELAGHRARAPVSDLPARFPARAARSLRRARRARLDRQRRGVGHRDHRAARARSISETGKLIVYTSADSVFQIAAHEETVPLDGAVRGVPRPRASC